MLQNQNSNILNKPKKSCFIWTSIVVVYVIIIFSARQTSHNTTWHWRPVNEDARPPFQNTCNFQTVDISQPCLCYVNVENSSLDQARNKCAMTIANIGRLGNVIGQYAALFTLSRLNQRPAVVIPSMANILQKYFKITLPVISEETETAIDWHTIVINDWMQESYKHFPGAFVKVMAHPMSITFFRGFQERLRREFTLKDEIATEAQRTLRGIKGARSSVTFIGVHARLGDYVRLMKSYRGVLADRKYFEEATGYFRKRFADAVFAVVSDDLEWCRENISNNRSDVYFVGNGNQTQPIQDFAVLMNCNHTIVTIGTFGFFAALFAGGETVYLQNFTMPDSSFNRVFHFDTAFPAHWHPIAADLSPYYAEKANGTSPPTAAV